MLLSWLDRCRDAGQIRPGMQQRTHMPDKAKLPPYATMLTVNLLMCAIQLAGVTEIKRQVELQLAEVNSSNASLQAQLDRANVNVDTLTARLSELGQQLASSSELGGSLRMQNTELLIELTNLR